MKFTRNKTTFPRVLLSVPFSFMKILRTSISLLALLLLVSLTARADDWLTDYNAALAQAKSSGKPVLLDFTGSDWCPWCIKMDKEVLDTPAFKDYAGKNLVLMLVDFPQTKQLPQKVQDQNDQLQKQYATEGFPTYILVDKDGKVLGQQVGYLDGGPTAFIAKLESFKK
jgi:protein disulfide-isomerase